MPASLNLTIPSPGDAGPAWAAQIRDDLQKIEQAILRTRDVRNYGAVLDGVTDDLAAINAACADLPVRGGDVLIPGVAAISGPVRPTRHGTRLKSLGRYAGGLVTSSATANLIELEGLYECEVNDLLFDSSVVRTGGSDIYAIGCQDYSFNNVRHKDGFRAATLVECFGGYIDRQWLAGNSWNRGVSMLGCVSTQMSHWEFDGGVCNLPAGNGWLEINSSCDTPHGSHMILEASSGAGTGLYVKNGLGATFAAAAGTVSMAAGGNVVTAQSGFTFTLPGPVANGDVGRVLTVAGAGLPGSIGAAPGSSRIGRVIDATHAVLCQAATTTVSGAAASMPTNAAADFAPRWLEFHSLAVEGSHPVPFGTNSYGAAQPGVVVDDVTSLKWFGGQSASGAIGMVLTKGTAISLHGVRIMNNDQHGIDVATGVKRLKTFGCDFSDNSQAQYAGTAYGNTYSGVSLTSPTQYRSSGDYFGDDLVGSSRKQRYGIQNSAGSIVYLSNPEWGGLGTDTVYDKTTLRYDFTGRTGTGEVRAATPVTTADLIAIDRNSGLSL